MVQQSPGNLFRNTGGLKKSGKVSRADLERLETVLKKAGVR